MIAAEPAISEPVIAEPVIGAKISERVVSEVWKRQLLAPPLRTLSGQAMEVVYAGRQCCDHGPDFRGALLVFDGELRRGDVEVHVRAADWRSHGHHRDHAYDGVILHVVLWPPPYPGPAGEALPIFCVAGNALTTPGGLASLLDSTPYVPFRCRATGDGELALLSADREAVLGLVDAAGEQRLRDKAAAIQGDLTIAAAEEVLYCAIMAALGFSRNTAAFAGLAESVPFSLLTAIALTQKDADRPLAIQAFLLGKAGLLQRSGPQALGAEVVQRLQARWNELTAWDDGARLATSWRLGRVRPANHPARRLAGAARLFAAAADAGLRQSLLSPLMGSEAAVACRCLERALMVSAPETANEIGEGGSHLIGRARAAEIAANAILPFALAYGETTGDGRLVRRALEASALYHAPSDNEFSRYMTALLFGESNPVALRTIRRQQGLLHLYKQWCRDKCCADCPIGRYPQL